MLYVHRLVWAILNGPIPNGMCIMHTCDNPSCFSPEHLFLGTLRDNAIDMASKGRQVFQKNIEKASRGETHGKSKITSENVIEIRNLYSSGMSQRKIAKRYGISQSNVCDIVNRRTWKHVD